MITSTSNQQIKNLIKLCTKSKARKEQNVFVAEGEKMFFEAPKELLEKVYVSETYYNRKKLDLKSYEHILDVVDDKVFKAISDTITPQGVLCVIRRQEYDLKELMSKEKPCFVLLEDVQDPGNLGTIIRTAEGAGVTAVIMSKGTVDIYNPKVIRSTMGSIFRVPFLYVEELQAVVKNMQQSGINVYAAHLKDSVPYDKRSYIEGTAFLIGNEGNGLTDQLTDTATGCVHIPMEGNVESLNAAVATSILIYEAYRQRR